MPEPRGLSPLRLDRVERRFPTPEGHAVQALRPISLEVESAEVVAVTGPSGAGKSTLLNIAGLLDRPTTGECYVRGQPTSSLNDRSRTHIRATDIGFVFQAFHLLLSRTAVENVMLGHLHGGRPVRERRDAADEALRRVGLAHRCNAFASTLSGGEKQRVAIARALAKRPGLILADEPTGNLDSAAATAVVEQLTDLAATGTSVVIVTHDPVVAAAADRRIDLLRANSAP